MCDSCLGHLGADAEHEEGAVLWQSLPLVLHPQVLLDQQRFGNVCSLVKYVGVSTLVGVECEIDSSSASRLEFRPKAGLQMKDAERRRAARGLNQGTS